MAKGTKTVVKKKKDLKVVKQGRVYINCTFNNTIVTVTDADGNVIAWSSAGACGYRGGKKSTPYVAQIVANTVSDKAKTFGFEVADLFVNGPGSGRESAIRSIQASGIKVKSIKDVTPIPHNGCRARKRRRV